MGEGAALIGLMPVAVRLLPILALAVAGLFTFMTVREQRQTIVDLTVKQRQLESQVLVYQARIAVLERVQERRRELDRLTDDDLRRVPDAWLRTAPADTGR